MTRAMASLDRTADKVEEAWLKKRRQAERVAFQRGFSDAFVGVYRPSEQPADLRADYIGGWNEYHQMNPGV